MSYHKVLIVGNLGRDPEMRYTPDGTPVTDFSVAANERWKSKDGTPNERTVWFRVTAWRELAELCNQYLSKGRQVFIEGRMNPDRETGAPRVWTRNDGTPGASYEVTALTVRFLGGRGEGADPSVSDQEPPPPDMGENEIPF